MSRSAEPLRTPAPSSSTSRHSRPLAPMRWSASRPPPRSTRSTGSLTQCGADSRTPAFTPRRPGHQRPPRAPYQRDPSASQNRYASGSFARIHIPRGYDQPVSREESPQERVNRELIELLNEVRVALPGVQVLFAFLLAVPFQNRFGRATSFEKHLYLVTLLSSATATACLIAPTGYHRLLFQRGERPRIIEPGTRM